MKFKSRTDSIFKFQLPGEYLEDTCLSPCFITEHCLLSRAWSDRISMRYAMQCLYWIEWSHDSVMKVIEQQATNDDNNNNNGMTKKPFASPVHAHREDIMSWPH